MQSNILCQEYITDEINRILSITNNYKVHFKCPQCNTKYLIYRRRNKFIKLLFFFN